MTKVDSDAWIAKAKKRKAYRDHMRDKFYGETGAKQGATTQSMSAAPQSQGAEIAKLLDLTAKGSLLDGGHKGMLDLTSGLIAELGFGEGEMGSQSATQDLLGKYSMSNLRKNWFWSPAFFD